jgi:antirestriction protein
MNHDEWRAEISRLMKLDGMELPALHELWSELLSQAEKAKQTSVGEWHIQQTLSLYSSNVRKLAELDSAAELDERIGDDAESQIKYWHTAAGTALARAALDRFKIDKKR